MTKADKLMFEIRQTAEAWVPDQLGRRSYTVALVGVGAMLLLIVGLYPRIPPVVPLYFSLPWGEARLAPRIMLYLLPTLGLVIAGTNLILAKMTGKLSALLPKMLSIESAIMVLMLLIALGGILQSLLIL